MSSERERMMKRPLIVDRSCQQATKMSKKNPPTRGGEPLKDSNHPCTTASAALLSRQHQHHRARPTIFILLLLAIGLFLFGIIPRENVIFDVENNGNNVLYEYECEFYCDALSSRVSNTSDTIDAATAASCNCGPGCVGLGEFNVNGCDLSAVLSATTIATGIENGIIFDGGDTRHISQPGSDVTAPPHTIGRTRPVGAGLHEFNVNECVFDENEFNGAINNTFDIYFNENYYDSDINNTYSYYATTATDENENKQKHEKGPDGTIMNTQTTAQIQHPTAPIIDRIHEIVVMGKGSREFDNIECIFNGNIDRIGLQYNMLSGMFIFIFNFFCIVLW